MGRTNDGCGSLQNNRLVSQMVRGSISESPDLINSVSYWSSPLCHVREGGTVT